MLVYLCGTPIWRTENSVHIWSLLWLSRRLIISTEQTKIYVSTFSNTLTSKKAQNHEMTVYFLTNAIACVAGRRRGGKGSKGARDAGYKRDRSQTKLVSKRSSLLSCKIVNRYKYTASYA